MGLVASIMLVGIIQPAISASTIPPISGLKIIDYKQEIVQEDGTSADYTVTIKNTGVLDLSPTYLMFSGLSSPNIPMSWFYSDDQITLEFKQTGELHYTLSIPNNTKGVYAFTLSAVGRHGEIKEIDTKPVLLKIIEANESATQEGKETTTTTEVVITIPTTTMPPTTSTVPITALTTFIKEQIKNPVSQVIGVLIVTMIILTLIRFRLLK